MNDHLTHMFEKISITLRMTNKSVSFVSVVTLCDKDTGAKPLLKFTNDPELVNCPDCQKKLSIGRVKYEVVACS